MGEGYQQIIIVGKSSDEMKYITEELEKLFPHYKHMSQYDLKHGEISNIYNTGLWTLIIGLCVVSIVLGVIVAFMNKSMMQYRNKEMSILYSLGYSRKNVMTILAIETYVLTGITLFFSFVTLFFIDKYYLQYTPNYQFFTKMFTPTHIVVVMLFVAMIMLISLVWSLFGVKKSKLKTYLEG